jgi:hypothetical protein
MKQDTLGDYAPQDPLIVYARIVNTAAEIERNLQRRRELRAGRSDAAKRGWETRRGQ